MSRYTRARVHCSAQKTEEVVTEKSRGRVLDRRHPDTEQELKEEDFGTFFFLFFFLFLFSPFLFMTSVLVMTQVTTAISSRERSFSEPHQPLFRASQLRLELLHLLPLLLRQQRLREEEGDRGVVMCSHLHHDDMHRRRNTTKLAGWSAQPALRPGNLRQRCRPHLR